VNLAFPILLSWPVARVVSSSCRYAAVFDLFPCSLVHILRRDDDELVRESAREALLRCA
jgi:hypothetical protein